MFKQIFKLINSFLKGGVIGLAGVTLIVVLFTDLSFSEFMHKLLNIEWQEGVLSALVAIVGFLIAITVQVILHEGGHLVCGLLTGYQFVSFRIFNWTFIRHDGKIRVKRFAIAGTSGQCLLSPPPEKPLDEIPVVWYNLGGLFANLLAVLVSLPLLWVVENIFVHEILFFFILVGVFFILMNGIPMKVGGVNNDAYNVFLLRKDKESKQALMVELRTNALIQQGVRPKDMPCELFSIDGEVDYKNPLQLCLYIMDASYRLDLEKWEEAHAMFEEAWRHKSEIIGLYVKEIACELIFTSLLTGRKDLASELYTDEQKKYILQYRKLMSSKERILCAIALYMEGDKAKAQSIYESVCQHQHEYLMQGEVKSDIALMKVLLA